MRLRSRLVQRRVQEPPRSCSCKWRHTLLLQRVGCHVVVGLRLLDRCTQHLDFKVQHSYELDEAAAILSQGNAVMAMLVQVPLARGVAELLLHPLQEAVPTAAALPRGAVQARSADR